MKFKKEYLILIILIAGLSLYLLLGRKDRTPYRLPDIPEVPASEISAVEISRPGGKILLEKKDGKWSISPEGYPADSAKIKGILDIIAALKLTALISESKSYARYDLQDEKKITVKAWSGKVLKREFDVGKAAPSFRHTFVKIAGDDRVYHAGGNFRSRFDQAVKDLRDKTVLRFERDEIQEVDITTDEALITLKRRTEPVEVVNVEKEKGEEPQLQKAKSMWQTPDGKEADEHKIDGLITALSTLNCREYLEGREKGDFTDAVYTVRLAGQKKYTLSIFKKEKDEDNDYPAVSSENAYPFLLPDSQANRIMIPLNDFLKNPGSSNRDK